MRAAPGIQRGPNREGLLAVAEVVENRLERADDFVLVDAALAKAQFEIELLGWRLVGKNELLGPARLWLRPRRLGAVSRSRHPGWRFSRSGQSFSQAFFA